MVAYLSDEWLERADAALSSHPGIGEAVDGLDLTIGYEVAGSPSGKRAYGIRLAEGTAHVEPGAHADAPVTFGLDYDTAVAIARSELSPQAAFMQGRLKLGGDVMVLIRDGAALAAVDDALASLRDDTEF